MKRFYLLGLLALASLASCSKAEMAEEENAWIEDDTKPVPVLFSTSGSISAQTKGIVTGNVMNGLDVGIIGVAEKTGDGLETVDWNQGDVWTTLIGNKHVTTGVDGSIVFSPKIYYPFGSRYAYTFYSYYPYSNSESQPASLENGSYSITYSLGDTDILWAKAEAAEYNGLTGFNARYCRAVGKAGEESAYFPKLQYKHLLTALAFKVVSNDAEITDYDIKVTGMELKDTYTNASLCVCKAGDEASAGTLVPGDNGRIGFTDLSVQPTTSTSDLCTILAYPSTSYTAVITLTFTHDENTDTHVLELPINGSSSYEAGYRYYFTVTVNKPEEVTIIQTSLEEWQDGTPEEGAEI